MAATVATGTAAAQPEQKQNQQQQHGAPEQPATSSTTASVVVLQPGQVIQNYEIVKPLGKGKFSIVYMAKRLSDDSMCALKKINIFDMMVPKQREKCLKEVRLLQSLDHPNIVKLKDSFIDNNELLIIVEWAEKGDLKRLIRRAISMGIRFKEAEIWEYSRQLSSALDHMHRKRVMHRDLKPANIFVTMNGSLKLGDLGLGRFFSSQTLEAFSKVGTPLYMSPEVLRGAGYDLRSDVWSLGCVLYELTMLRSPFKSDEQLSLYDLFVRISKGDFAPLPDTVCSDFRELLDQMLALDPVKRIDVEQVLKICNAQVAALVARVPGSSSHGTPKAHGSSTSATAPRAGPSPLLVMDDIVEKLKLLECEEKFLRPRGFPILHRCFFVQRVETPEAFTQFEVMYELIQWLLGMLKAREQAADQKVVTEDVAAAAAADASAGPCIAAPSTRSTAPASKPAAPASCAGALGAGDAAAGCGPTLPPKPPAEVCRGSTSGACLALWAGVEPAVLIKELVADLTHRGIQISSDTTRSQLQQGFGEGICLILNELINQELVERNFHFEEPDWGDAAGQSGDLSTDTVDTEAELEPRSDAPADADSDEDALEAQHCGPVTAARVSSVLEPVHVADVDVNAWLREVERIKPLLRQHPTPEVSGWRYAIDVAQRLCKDIDGLCKPLLSSQGLLDWCKCLHQQLDNLRLHEDQLNALYSDQAASLAQLRVDAAAERDQVVSSQAKVTDMSQALQSLEEEVERSKEEAAARCDNVCDPEQLPRLRHRLQQLMAESCQLEVRTRCLQAELLARQKASRTA